jgi:hypothetical protein
MDQDQSSLMPLWMSCCQRGWVVAVEGDGVPHPGHQGVGAAGFVQQMAGGDGFVEEEAAGRVGALRVSGVDHRVH